MKEKYQISFSGGRTSGYMTKKLIDNYSHIYDFIVTFANTGLEHEKTLEFVNNCDKHFGFNTVWLEADVIHGQRKGTGFKIVNFETASRNAEPFEEVIKKYGVPNPSYLHCTRELKLAPMQAFLKSLDIDYRKIKTAIGIRNDETRRVSKTANEVNIVYPLIDIWATDKQDVLDWWEDQIFDLGLEEWDGNCKLCYKKSFKKLFKQMDSDVKTIEWYKNMEDMYGSVGTKNGGNSRVFFRGNISAKKLQEMYIEDRTGLVTELKTDMYSDGGCSESCEVYSTEKNYE